MKRMHNKKIKLVCTLFSFFSTMHSMDEAAEKQNKKDTITSDGIRLMAAIDSGDLFAVGHRLNKKADPNTKITSESRSICALSHAVKKRHHKIALALLVAKADPNNADKNGVTPLMEAAKPVIEIGSLILVGKLKAEQVPMIQALLKHNADPAVQDVTGKRASDYSSDEAIKKLIESKTE